MEKAITELVKGYETGGLTRRGLIRGLTMLLAGTAAVPAAAEVLDGSKVHVPNPRRARMTATDPATSKQELSDIEQVVATQQIYNVVMRYIRGHDRADREMVKSVYWEDGYDDHGSMWQGNAWEFSKLFTRNTMSGLGLGSLEEPSSGSLTFLANHTVEFEGRDVAYSEAYFTTSGVTIIDEETASQGWFAGRYIDRFERRDGEWRIFHRICVQDWGRTETFPRSDLVERNVFAGTFPTGQFYPEDIVYQRDWLDKPGSRPGAKPNDPPVTPDMFQKRMPYDDPRYKIVK